MYFIHRAIIHVSFAVLQHCHHQVSPGFYVHSFVNMSKINLNRNTGNNSNNNRNDDWNNDVADCDSVVPTAALDAMNINDATGWSVTRRPQRKKSVPENTVNFTKRSTHRSRRSICTKNAVLEWMNQFPSCKLVPAAASTATVQSKQQQPLQQHILLLVGLPGSGKTVIAKTLCRVFPWKYMHVNQDILQSRPACLRETQRILDLGKCPIIDRCNVSEQQRQYFTQFTSSSSASTNIAANNDVYIPVDCVVIQTVSVQECIQRCEKRADHPTLQPHQVRRVIGMIRKEWQEPKPLTSTKTTNKLHETTELLRSVVTIRSDAELQQWITNLVSTATAPSITNQDP